jgi:hypothetical protein
MLYRHCPTSLHYFRCSFVLKMLDKDGYDEPIPGWTLNTLNSNLSPLPAGRPIHLCPSLVPGMTRTCSSSLEANDASSGECVLDPRAGAGGSEISDDSPAQMKVQSWAPTGRK